jgi:phosphoribosylaminoimidazole-succinocarboxamide synthase
VHEEVARFGGHVGERLAQLQSAVALQLQQVTAEVSRGLQDGMALMQDAQKTMGQRLDEASRAVSEVHGQLGALGEATRRMEQVGRDISGLEQILRAPKIRGGLGEVLLERLLADMLPAEAYRLQHGFRSGEKVDAAVVLAGKLVPIDSKFPLENFRRMVEEGDDDRRRAARRAFLRDVRSRVDEIARRYILPDEDTFDFALMYIPAENVYYEVILREDAGEESLLGYALSRRVVPVSPNSFYAYLQVILLGLRGLRIEQNAREILGVLGRLQVDAGKLREHFDTLGRHITNAKNKYDEAATSLARLPPVRSRVTASRTSAAAPAGSEWTLDDLGALVRTDFRELPLRGRGKVRDVYDLGDDLLFVATDRISAFDWVLPNGIPDKGKVLTQLSTFWFGVLGAVLPTHLRSARPGDDPRIPARYAAALADRAMIVRKATVYPVECVARGYLAGSGWKDYQRTGAVCGVALPAGLRQADRLPAPIFTPATKATSGHDENIPFEEVVTRLGQDTAVALRDLTLRCYERGAALAEACGIIVADTKFEFGQVAAGLLLADEAMTPDSSRFWPADRYAPGQSPPSFDKQFVRDWLESTTWDKNSAPPRLPDDVVAETRARYVEALVRLTGHGLG